MIIFQIIHQFFFIPHWLLFYSHKNKSLIIDDIYCIETKSNSNFQIAKDLTKTLAKNKYFRTLFYYRTQGFFSNVLRVFYPRDNRFTIDVNTEIGGGIILAHPYSTIINANKIGKNLYVNQLVTIGEKDGKKPIIGNNVKLYTNCTIIGGITIGDNAVVGAGAVVIKNIPNNTVVAGNPAKIIKTIKTS